MIRCDIIFNNGDALENVLCKVDYEKNIAGIYSETGDKTSIIPMSSIMKIDFKGKYDTEKGDVDTQVEEGW